MPVKALNNSLSAFQQAAPGATCIQKLPCGFTSLVELPTYICRTLGNLMAIKTPYASEIAAPIATENTAPAHSAT